MAKLPDSTMEGNLQTVEGVLDRLVFSGDTSDFMVARLVIRGRREPVTIVGSLPSAHPGETLVLKGEWEFDKKFGEQFRFQEAKAIAPSTIRGIEKYLSSSLIKGIGPEMARRITTVFGEKTLDVIEHTPEALLKVAGIGRVRSENISQAFADQKSIRDVMLFLQTHGISTAYAFRIFKKYGNRAVEAVSHNPYCLATDVRGIGFRSADKVAGSLGIDMRSPLRARAGILHVLDTLQSDGHVYCPSSSLLEKARELLGIDRRTLETSLDDLAKSGEITIEDDRVYRSIMAAVENSVAMRMRNLISSPRFLPPIKLDAAIGWIESRTGMTLSAAQRDAICEAIHQKVLIITGGPGTGKTTLLKALIMILEAKGLRVLLGAPTGRAAKRLSEATGREAATIHRLLEYSPGAGGFQRNAARQLEAEFVIVDEVSMVDISLMHHLLSAIHLQSTLILVGDADQLPSVGPGNVLGDLIESGKIPAVRLQTVFRQAFDSLIVTNAHLVNEGKMPINESPQPQLSDFYLIEKNDPEGCLRLIKDMVGQRIPERFGFDPHQDVQVLSPMHKGLIGTENLNRELRQILNPAGLPTRGDRFRVGDRVMQTRNNYDKEVFNGDVGRIISYDPEWDEAVVEFDARPVTYHVSEMDEITLAYAVTIHKAQGSEYRAVIIPLSTQHFVLLRRNLLYTAMTRAKELVIIVGSRRALQIAVENSIVEPRFTYLGPKL
ncbi:MAG: ATP-dependent RecD-like DNA helicase [Desulfomonile sp.]